jgi:hypothetical protein
MVLWSFDRCAGFAFFELRDCREDLAMSIRRYVGRTTACG